MLGYNQQKMQREHNTCIMSHCAACHLIKLNPFVHAAIGTVNSTDCCICKGVNPLAIGRASCHDFYMTKSATGRQRVKIT